MTIPFLDVNASHVELRAELQKAFERVVASGQYVLGEEVESFEHDFAQFCGTQHAIGVGNGLDALTIALRSRGIGPGDEVIVPVHTFIATWLAIAQCGAKIVPVDVEPNHLLIDPDAVATACSSRSAAIVPVHLYGCPVDPLPLEQLAHHHKLLLISDAAQAHGARTSGRSVGAIGDASIFSFYPAKNLGALGDGGAITTDDFSTATRARRIRNYGSESKYDFTEFGVNSRLDPLQAAFLRVKLEALPRWNARRIEIANRYLDELADVTDLVLPARPEPGVVHVWHIFCVRHSRRDELSSHLRATGIQTQVHYPIPPHLSTVFSDLGFGKGSFPVAEHAAETVLSLPIGPHLGDQAVTSVINAVRAFGR